MARPPKNHAAVLAQIKAIARAHMAENGAAALSLGAIARRMGLTTPALYRYFESRDALVTDLIKEAYTELGEETEAALADLDPTDLALRFQRLVSAYRRWAITHSADYVLIHGAIFPGYEAPIQEVLASAWHTVVHFVELLRSAARLGVLKVPSAYRDPPPGLRTALEPIEELIGDPELAPLVTLAFTTWLNVHSLVWEELTGHMPKEVFADGTFFELEMHLLAERLGLRAQA